MVGRACCCCFQSTLYWISASRHSLPSQSLKFFNLSVFVHVGPVVDRPLALAEAQIRFEESFFWYAVREVHRTRRSNGTRRGGAPSRARKRKATSLSNMRNTSRSVYDGKSRAASYTRRCSCSFGSTKLLGHTGTCARGPPTHFRRNGPFSDAYGGASRPPTGRRSEHFHARLLCKH